MAQWFVRCHGNYCTVVDHVTSQHRRFQVWVLRGFFLVGFSPSPLASTHSRQRWAKVRMVVSICQPWLEISSHHGKIDENLLHFDDNNNVWAHIRTCVAEVTKNFWLLYVIPYKRTKACDCQRETYTFWIEIQAIRCQLDRPLLH